MAITRIKGGNWEAQSGHPFLAADLPVAVYKTSSGYVRARADAEANARATALVVGINGASLRIATNGDIIDTTGMNLTPAKPHFLADTASGKNVTDQEPLSLGAIHLSLFVTSSTNEAVVCIGEPWLIADLSAGSGGVTDGDKGDIVISSGGTVWQIEGSSVNNQKLTPIATGTLKGRLSAGTGAVEDLTAAQVRQLLGLLAEDIHAEVYTYLYNLAGRAANSVIGFDGTTIRYLQVTDATVGGGGITPAAPTGFIVDDNANTGNWTNNPSYPDLNQYEYTLNGGATVATVTAKPIAVGDIDAATGQVGVRVKAAGSDTASAWLFNTSPYTASTQAVLFRETFANNSYPNGAATNTDIGTIGFKRTLQAGKDPINNPTGALVNNPATSTTAGVLYSGIGIGSSTPVHANDAGLYEAYTNAGEHGFYNSNGVCRRQLAWTDKYALTGAFSEFRFYMGCENTSWKAYPAVKIGSTWYISGNGVTMSSPVLSTGAFDTDAELKTIAVDRNSTTEWKVLTFSSSSLDIGAAVGAALPAGSVAAFGVFFDHRPGGVPTDTTAFIRIDQLEIL